MYNENTFSLCLISYKYETKFHSKIPDTNILIYYINSICLLFRKHWHYSSHFFQNYCRIHCCALICAFVPAFSVEEAEAKSLWDTCLLKISPKCALDIIDVVFENLTITDACCHDLVQEGKMCHDTLI
ncbi:hypothetical protein F2Q68_00020785 [Brassica cretica]|uniref:Prolamin-like domain-containing protein n=1 Tax=Brassica cretica TaxID=69181 RepID=A0A8S9FYL2_BRACR|nr:hypothetical protein F2Q68_00020785 [Brassica cretica]